MVAVLLAALQIVWTGPGHPAGSHSGVPAIIARAIAGRGPAEPRELRLVDGATPVWAHWQVAPEDGVVFSNELAPRYYAGTPGTYVSPADYRGPVTLHAGYQGRDYTLPGFVYDSIAVGCFMNFYNGLRFDDDGAAHASGTPYESDIFFSGAAHVPGRTPWYGCTGPFTSPNRTFVLHVPYGGRLLRPQDGAYFGYVRASDWRDEFTIAPAVHPGDILIFRTRSGRIVKMTADDIALMPGPDAFGGAYLVSLNGEFADYAYYTRHPYQPHAVFGPHHQ